MIIQTEYIDKPMIPGRVWDLIRPNVEFERIRTAFFFVHGGGWRGGSRDRFHSIIETLADRGHPCATTDYRLDSVHIPEQLSDVRHCYARFIQTLQQAGQSAEIVVVGSSAGGHLALLLALAKPEACGDASIQDQDLAKAAQVRPIGVAVQAAPVTFVPWTDIFPESQKCMENAVGVTFEDRPDLYERVSPINHIDSLSPPVFSMESQYEHMFPHHISKQFYDKMRSTDRRVVVKNYPGTEHGFFYDTARWQQAQAIEDLCDFANSLYATKDPAEATGSRR